MTPKRIATFRIDDELLAGMQALWERDGVQPSEQVRRAIREWLKSRGIVVEKSGRKRAATRRRA